jgi:hypothetical protein
MTSSHSHAVVDRRKEWNATGAVDRQGTCGNEHGAPVRAVPKEGQKVGADVYARRRNTAFDLWPPPTIDYARPCLRPYLTSGNYNERRLSSHRRAHDSA